MGLRLRGRTASRRWFFAPSHSCTGYRLVMWSSPVVRDPVTTPQHPLSSPLDSPHSRTNVPCCSHRSSSCSMSCERATPSAHDDASSSVLDEPAAAAGKALVARKAACAAASASSSQGRLGCKASPLQPEATGGVPEACMCCSSELFSDSATSADAGTARCSASSAETTPRSTPLPLSSPRAAIKGPNVTDISSSLPNSVSSSVAEETSAAASCPTRSTASLKLPPLSFIAAGISGSSAAA